MSKFHKIENSTEILILLGWRKTFSNWLLRIFNVHILQKIYTKALKKKSDKTADFTRAENQKWSNPQEINMKKLKKFKNSFWYQILFKNLIGRWIWDLKYIFCVLI